MSTFSGNFCENIVNTSLDSQVLPKTMVLLI